MRSTLFLSLLLVFPLCFTAQEKPQLITEPIHKAFLEHLIKEGIDSVRQSHGLLPLANDSILFVAAQHHALYLKEKGKLSHFEKGVTDYETPQERAISYGASNHYLVGENVAANFYFKKVTLKKGKTTVYKSYRQLANAIVTQWVKSPGHYQNIITSSYNKTGLAIAINELDNKVYIVQKFAQVKFQYRFEENKRFFNYSNFQAPPVINSFDTSMMHLHEGKHAWKTKSPQHEKRYIESNQIIDADPRLLEIDPNGRSIIVSTAGTPHLSKFIQRRKDGLAIELMRYDEYHCGNPEYYLTQSRRNEQCEFSGQLLKPVYKRKLHPRIEYSYASKFKGLNNKHFLFTAAVKAFKPKLKKHFKYKLGKIPKGEQGYLEFNLVYLKKKEVVRVRHVSGVCGVPLENYPFPGYQYHFSNDTLAFDLPTIDSTFFFYFSKGVSHYNINDITPLLYNGFEKFLIDSAQITAFSSVEGLTSINERLQQERAESIANALQSRQDLDFSPIIKTSANWDLFYKQLKNNQSLSYINQLSRTQQKKHVDSLLQLDSNWTELQLLLDSQRYASIQLHAIYNYKKYQLALFTQYFNRLQKQYEQSLKSDAPSSQLPLKFQQLLYSVFQSIERGDIDQEHFTNFKPPWNTNFQRSFYHYYLLSDRLKLPAKEGRWTNLYNLKTAEDRFIKSEIINNMLVEQFEGYRTNKDILFQRAETLENSIKVLSNRENYSSIADSFLIVLYIDILNKVESLQETEIFERASSYIFNKYSSLQSVDLDELLSIAKLFVYIKDYNKAYLLLHPRINLDQPHLGILSLYSKLIYQNSIEFPGTLYGEWLKKIEPLFPTEEWCNLFVGPCNISFQVFDDESVRELYCKKCSTFGNYATRALESEQKSK